MSRPGDVDIVYRPRGRIAGAAPGAHRGRDTGGLGTFRDQVPFWRMPDARRLDLRATLRDPFEGIYVRRFETRTPLQVWALVDLSASMRFRGGGDRQALAGRLCTVLAASATRIGDAFGLAGFDETLREDVFLPATRRRPLAVEAAGRSARAACSGRGADGVIEAAARLAGRTKLVFLISDFRWPEALVEAAFAALAGHDVAPVLLADSAEEADLPAWGLMELDDLEGGGRRVVFMRPGLRTRWLERERARVAHLHRVAGAYGRPPYRLAGRFDPEALTRHMLSS